MKLKSLKKQLKASTVDWHVFGERAKDKPGEINANIIRQALQKREDPIPYHILQNVIKSARELGCYETLINQSTLRYASCFIPDMSAEIMNLLLDNMDKDTFQLYGNSTPNESNCKDYLDIILGGHIICRKYSIQAIVELLKRSSRKNLLHSIYTSWEFHYLSHSELELVSKALIEKNPDLLSTLDKNYNIPLYHACRLRYIEIIKVLINESVRYNLFENGGLMIKNEKGITPLQNLVRSECIADSVVSLLDELFQRDILMAKNIEEVYLVHETLHHRNKTLARYLLNKFPNEIRNMTIEGNLPLHIGTSMRLDLDLIEVMICEGISQLVGKGCGGLCIRNIENIAPIQFIIKSYYDSDVATFLDKMLVAGTINEKDIIEKQVLELAIKKKSTDVVRFIVQRFPKVLRPFHHQGNSSTSLGLACRQNFDHTIISLMIEKGLGFYKDDEVGGLLLPDENEINPLQLLAGMDSREITNLLKDLFVSEEPLLHPKLIIKYSLDRIAICKSALENYVFFYNCLSDEMKKLSMESVDNHGRGIIFHTLKNRHDNDFVFGVVKEKLRLCLDSGLFDKDYFGDMPINIVLRTHFPRWSSSTVLVQELIKNEIITKHDISKYNLLHKIAQWPRCEHCRQKALALIHCFPQGLSKRNKNGNLPIHEVLSVYNDWEDVKSSLSLFIRNGLKIGVGGLGGLLQQSETGYTVLEICLNHEIAAYNISNNPDRIIDMMWVLSHVLKPSHQGLEPFFKSVLTLTPCKILPKLLTMFDNSIAFVQNGGKLMIHISIERGLKWVDGLEKIYDVNKPALLRQDCQNCYPLLLAAAGANSDLNTIFELLRKEVIPVVSAVLWL